MWFIWCDLQSVVCVSHHVCSFCLLAHPVWVCCAVVCVSDYVRFFRRICCVLCFLVWWSEGVRSLSAQTARVCVCAVVCVPVPFVGCVMLCVSDGMLCFLLWWSEGQGLSRPILRCCECSVGQLTVTEPGTLLGNGRHRHRHTLTNSPYSYHTLTKWKQHYWYSALETPKRWVIVLLSP